MLLHDTDYFLRSRQSPSHSRISNILWNPKVHYRVRKSSPLVSTLSQINLFCTTLTYFSKIYFYINTHFRLRVPSGLIPSSFPINVLHAFLFCSHACCILYPFHHPWLFTLIIFGEERSYGAPHYAVFSNLLPFHPSCVQIFCLAPCSQTPSVHVFPLMSETKFHTHTKLQEKL
jgi:hypothetical protein